jgi:hypothetical protein
VCSAWQSYAPDKPEKFGAGLCNDTFGKVVGMFVNEKMELLEKLREGGFTLCGEDEDEENFHASAGNIMTCVETIEYELDAAKGGTMTLYDRITNQEITLNGVSGYAADYCKYQYNYWRRGPSETELGDATKGLDFAQAVLGIDYIGNYGGRNDIGTEVYLQPVDVSHPLARGYESTVNVGKYFGTSNISLVTTGRFSSVPRSNTIMYLNTRGTPIPDGAPGGYSGKEIWPAIIVSNPTLSINKRGLIVYYAFAPEELIQQGYGGLRLIDNLMSFMLQ